MYQHNDYSRSDPLEDQKSAIQNICPFYFGFINKAVQLRLDQVREKLGDIATGMNVLRLTVPKESLMKRCTN